MSEICKSCEGTEESHPIRTNNCVCGKAFSEIGCCHWCRYCVDCGHSPECERIKYMETHPKEFYKCKNCGGFVKHETYDNGKTKYTKLSRNKICWREECVESIA